MAMAGKLRVAGMARPHLMNFRPLPSRTISAFNLFLGHIFLQESDESLNRHSLEKCTNLQNVTYSARSLQDLGGGARG